MIEIDIHKPAMSKEEISELRSDLEKKITVLQIKIRGLKRVFCVGVALLVLVAVAANLHWSFLTVDELLEVGTALGMVIALSAAGGAVVAAGSSVGVGVGVVAALVVVAAVVVGMAISVDVDVVAGAGVFLVVCVVVAACLSFIKKQVLTLRTLQLEFDSLIDAESSMCVDIKLWLASKDIDSFRRSVVAQERTFLACEVDAMRSSFQSADRIRSEEKQKAEIEQACKEVYLTHQ